MEREGSDWIPLNGLTPPHFRAYTKTKPGLPSQCAVVNFILSDL